MTGKKEFVQAQIKDNKVVVFSKSYCPYCKKAKAALSQFLPPDAFAVLELDQRDDGDEIIEALTEITGGSTVPRVFIGGEFIGGGDDTARLAGTGELETKLVQAGAK